MMTFLQTAKGERAASNDTFIVRISILFLQAVIVLLGIGTFVFLLWEPHVEGVNANATTLFEIYFDDPFLAYVYLASIPFFVALYKAILLLGTIGNTTIFSQDSVRAVRTIRHCALALVAAIFGAELFIVLTQYGKDDIAGGVAMGVVAMGISVVIATAAVVFEKLLHSGVRMQSGLE